MLNFTFWSPTEFVFGKKTESMSGELIKKHGGSRVLIHYGGGSAQKSGLLDIIQNSINKAGLFSIALGGAKPNPLSGLVYEGINIIKKNNIDFVLALGGGSAIDSAKAMAAGALYDGDFWDFFSKKSEPEISLPVGCVLTIAAAGSESSASAVITNEKTNQKRGFNSPFNRPKFSIMNPEWTYSLPNYHKACGISDMMAHIFERYFTQVTQNDLTDRLCEGVLCAIIKSGPEALQDPQNYDAHAQIMWAGTIAHNDTVGVGRVGDWGPHGMAHELSSNYGAIHGAALAALFPAWMTYQLERDDNPKRKHSDVMRFAQFANRVWGIGMDFENPIYTAREGIRAYTQFLRRIGMPVNLKELDSNIKLSDIKEMAETVGYHRPDELGNFNPLHKGDVIAVYEMAYGFGDY